MEQVAYVLDWRRSKSIRSHDCRTMLISYDRLALGSWLPFLTVAKSIPYWGALMTLCFHLKAMMATTCPSVHTLARLSMPLPQISRTTSLPPLLPTRPSHSRSSCPSSHPSRQHPRFDSLFQLPISLCMCQETLPLTSMWMSMDNG